MKLKMIYCVIALTAMLMATPAMAEYFTITPEDTYSVSAIGETVAFELFYNPETDGMSSISAFELDFLFDSTELNFSQVTYSPTGFGNLFPEDPAAVDNTLHIAAGSIGAAAVLPENTSISLAILEFTVVDLVVFDGLSDFELLSQNGTSTGMMDGENDPHINGGAVGADVGAVPIPGAVVLMGTGLLGLAGLRRRNRC